MLRYIPTYLDGGKDPMVRIAEDVVEGGGGAALAPAPLPRNLRQLASRLLHAFRFIPCHLL